MEITKTVKMIGVEMEALFEKEDKNIRVKWYQCIDQDLHYDDSKKYKYEILFRCSEGTTDKEIKDFIKSVKGTKPKLKAEYISQIHVFETVNKMFITNTKDFTLKELEEHFDFLNKIKKSCWKDTSRSTGKNTYVSEKIGNTYFSINVDFQKITKIETQDNGESPIITPCNISKVYIKDLLASGRLIQEVKELFDNFINND